MCLFLIIIIIIIINFLLLIDPKHPLLFIQEKYTQEDLQYPFKHLLPLQMVFPLYELLAFALKINHSKLLLKTKI